MQLKLITLNLIVGILKSIVVVRFVRFGLVLVKTIKVNQTKIYVIKVNSIKFDSLLMSVILMC